MATAPALLPIEEYLRTSYSPDVDYTEGEIQERHLGEYDHSKLQSLILFTFMLNAKRWGVDAVVEQRLRVAPARVRVCDVVVLRADAPRESVTVTPPLICVEVLSPEDRLARARLVLADYLAMGVEHIWLVDPVYRAAWTFTATGLHEADPANLVVPNTPIRLDLTEAFAALDSQ